MIKIPEFLQEDFNTHFSWMSASMADSPDGPYATRMRELARARVLSDEDLSEVLGRCAGTLSLSKQLLSESDKQCSSATVLMALAIGSGMTQKASALLDPMLYAEEHDPQLAAASSASLIHTYFAPFKPQ